METKEVVGILAVVALAWWLGRRTTPVPVDEVPKQPQEVAPVVSNGQVYDIHLSLTGSAYNGLSNEYFPLFGFVGMAQR